MAEQDKHAANRVLLLRRGHPVFALVEAVRELSDELKAASLSWGAHRDKYLVPIALQEDLYLVIKKPNSVSLHGCKCSAPVRGAEECLSLNEACTRILQAYKPHVRSHTGNAFLIVRYERYPAVAQQELFATLAPLSELREEKVRTYEASLRFRRAITSALNFHREQTRKGGTVPYISHVLAVTSIVQEHGGTEDQAIAALLHDAVDNGDGHAALEDIERKFSRRVADSSVRTTRVLSVDPSRSPNTCLLPCASMPSATRITRSRKWMPSTITTGRSRSPKERDSHCASCCSLKPTKRREVALLDVDSAGSDGGKGSSVLP